MTTVKTEGSRAPVIDCPVCGAKDVVMSCEGTYIRREEPKQITVWSCSACGKVPNIEHDIVIKRWVTTAELEAMGWKPGIEEGDRLNDPSP